MMSSATMIFLGVVFLVWTAIAAVAVWLIYPDRFRQRIVDLSERSQAGLAPQDRLLTGDIPDFDSDDGLDPDPALLRAAALECEDAARAIAGVTNS